jgi:hypothetical protein
MNLRQYILHSFEVSLREGLAFPWKISHVREHDLHSSNIAPLTSHF